MSGLKMTMLGALAVAGFVTTAADVQAFGKRKKNRGNDCECAAPCDPCSGGGAAYRADAFHGGMPLAMPGRGDVIPASGTLIPATGGVIPASGTVPATESYWYDPRSGYYQPQGQSYNQGFWSGMMQGGTGNWYYPSTTPANYAGRRLGGLFRR
jgi:hypothetical protein